MSTTFVTCPAEATQTLGIKMPFLVMIIKNMRKYFSFEVTVRWRAGQPRPRPPPLTRAPAAQVIDDKGIKRRFRASNFQARSAGRLAGSFSVGADASFSQLRSQRRA